MTDFNFVGCDFCGKEARREGHFRILDGWMRIDAESRDRFGTLTAHPRQFDACPDCIRAYPILQAMCKDTRDPRATCTRNAQVGDAELLEWVDTWLDGARFDNRLSKEEQDACDVALMAVARLQKEGDE